MQTSASAKNSATRLAVVGSRKGAARTGPVSPPSFPPVDHMFEFATGAETIQCGRGKHVVIAGDRLRCFYVNRDGWLARYKILHNGNRQIVDFVLPGEALGLQACLFDRSPYSIVTVTPTSLSVIPLEGIDELCVQNPQLCSAVFWSIVRESARSVEHLIDASRRSAYERLSHLLLELYVRLDMTKQTDGMSFHMPLTQDLLADALGLTAIHLNRTMRMLREDGLVEIENKRVTIRNFDALSSLCDFETSYLRECGRISQKPYRTS
jgi:CRP-like cAMP-binding protein